MKTADKLKDMREERDRYADELAWLKDEDAKQPNHLRMAQVIFGKARLDRRIAALEGKGGQVA